MSINSWIDGKVLEILQASGVELPGGDGDTLRSIAQAWDTMGNALTDAGRALQGGVAGVDEQGWHGDAREAFEKHWQKQKSAIDRLASSLHQVATGLRSYAAEIDSINESIIDICVQIAEMEVAGVALSFFTGFLSDLVANTAVAAKVAKIIDLVGLFTSAAEKVAALLERFGALSEEAAAGLTTVARVMAGVLKDGAETFITNFVADTGSAMANQSVSGQPVTVGADMTGGARAALGTTAFTVGGAEAAERAGLSGVAGNILKGEGLLGTTLNGAAGNVAGGLTADVLGGRDGTTVGEDVLANAATGAAGNAQNHGIHHVLEDGGSLGGDNLSERGELTDAAFRNTVDTTMNTSVYAAGSGIESDVQALVKDSKAAEGETQ
jgi:uncharacterized protein YukE